MKKVAVLFADGFEEVEAVTPVDFLRRAGLEVTTVGVTGSSVLGGHGISIIPDIYISDLKADDYDAVIVPGGMPGAENVAGSEEAKKFISTIYERKELVAAICAAPAVVLQPLGILSGRKATCYPGFESRFSSDVEFSTQTVVEDGNVITSRGPGTAAAFAVAIIRRLLDGPTAEKIRERTLNIR
ncbi:MAG TPA: DJ-1/PfpI family protein [Sediminispirochaeta sp.]|nr:DJ-1/PfpI family protein [Sediminispirochaeta sp.]